MWAQFLVWVTGPIVARVLTTLGMGVVSYTGLSSVLVLVFNQVQANLGAMPADVAQIVFLTGIPQSIAIVLSALSARAVMEQVSRIQRIV